MIHTIPVPVGWSVEQAWEAIRRGERIRGPVRWANIDTEIREKRKPKKPRKGY